MPDPKVLLCILDGYGLNPNSNGNAVALARKPTLDKLIAEVPSATLITYGERVGLPAGQMGNSEVGHLNIGAGREVEQWLLRIDRELKRGTAFTQEVFQNFISKISGKGALHLIGLFSDGGVHSHSEHLYQLLRAFRQIPNLTEVILHIITDGRDTLQTAAYEEVKNLLDFIKEDPRIKIGSLSGRFFAMDRDKRWQRTERAYQVICNDSVGSLFSVEGDLLKYLKSSYESGITDEFIEPVSFLGHRGIQPHDGVLFWNYRADRMRQLVAALSLPSFTDFPRPASHFAPERSLMFTDYDPTFGLPCLFPTQVIRNYLGEVIARHGLKELRAAESEKYPHVTYFLNGGIEEASERESRLLVPSPRDIKTYDLLPEMSAPQLTDNLISEIQKGSFNFICVNYANCDMVGHTGVLEAAIKAVECVDSSLGKLLPVARQYGYQILIIADHGNAEQMINYYDGSPHTTHTTYPVPIILVNGEDVLALREEGALCDVAPTVLDLLGIKQPTEMTGESLLVRTRQVE
jgi:2,3-bisphosphoglycerate-independent phosphoglycerate mutase